MPGASDEAQKYLLAAQFHGERPDFATSASDLRERHSGAITGEPAPGRAPHRREPVPDTPPARCHLASGTPRAPSGRLPSAAPRATVNSS